MRFMSTIFIFSAGLAGCGLSSNAPNPHWLTDLQKTDLIVVQKSDSHVKISDVETIVRLQSIYTNAKWKQYTHTLPNHLDAQTIEFHDGGTKLGHFNYTGVLWETDSYTKNRTTELSDADRQWIESLFEMVPAPKSQIQFNNEQ